MRREDRRHPHARVVLPGHPRDLPHEAVVGQMVAGASCGGHEMRERDWIVAVLSGSAGLQKAISLEAVANCVVSGHTERRDACLRSARAIVGPGPCASGEAAQPPVRATVRRRTCGSAEAAGGVGGEPRGAWWALAAGDGLGPMAVKSHGANRPVARVTRTIAVGPNTGSRIVPPIRRRCALRSDSRKRKGFRYTQAGTTPCASRPGSAYRCQRCRTIPAQRASASWARARARAAIAEAPCSAA